MTVRLRIYVTMTLTEENARKLQALVQNEIYEDETPEEQGHRHLLFERIKNGSISPSGRAREATVSFSFYEETAKWLEELTKYPLYEDESKEEEAFRKLIQEEFWCPDLYVLNDARVHWNHIPF